MFRCSFVLALALTLVIPQLSFAENQITREELNLAISNAAKSRKKDAEDVRRFFTSKPVESVLRTAKIDPNRMERAISTLSAEELQRISSQTRGIEADFAAGALTNQELTYIVIALAAAVLVLVVVAA